MDRNRLYKLLGTAGMAGLVATGVLVSRNERTRRAYTSEEVRTRLRERAASTGDNAEPASTTQD